MSHHKMAGDIHSSDRKRFELPFISVIIPVLNGEGRLENCLTSLQKQTYPEDRFEIIIADGGSTDRTVEIAQEYGVQVVNNPKRIVAVGRNIGIKSAQGDFLAFTDDDCILPPDWLSKAEFYLRDISIGGVGGPTPLPDSATNFSKAVFTLFRWAATIGYSVQSDVPIASDAYDLPGANVIYRASVINEAGLFYDEKLITAEDVDLNIRIVNKGYRLAYRYDLRVWHDKRDRPLRFFHQIRRFAIGRIQLGLSHKGALRPLHTFMGFFAPLVLVIGVSAVTAGYISYAMVVLLLAIATLFLAGFASSGSLRVALLCLPVAVIFVLGWSVGYISSILFLNKIKKQI